LEIEKLKPSIESTKAAILIAFDIAKKKRGSGADFDNRNNTKLKT